jgi:hypothetical protein
MAIGEFEMIAEFAGAPTSGCDTDNATEDASA